MLAKHIGLYLLAQFALAQSKTDLWERFTILWVIDQTDFSKLTSELIKKPNCAQCNAMIGCSFPWLNEVFFNLSIDLVDPDVNVDINVGAVDNRRSTLIAVAAAAVVVASGFFYAFFGFGG